MILAAPTQRPISSIVTRIGAWLPRGWGDLARQLAIFALFDLLYEATRTLAVGDRAVALRHNHAFPLVRNVFIVANAIGLACYTLHPAAPPRMLGSLGFVDTLNATSVNHHSGLIASLSNPY